MSEKIHRDQIEQRLERQALATGDESGFVSSPLRGDPRWRVDRKWIEFECGCRAERCAVLFDEYGWDPVIFRKMPEQAVYDYVCAFHEPKMNHRIAMGGKYKDFGTWRTMRRNRLMGK